MKIRGFTLIESIVVMVVLGIAMVTISSFIVPLVTRSADLHYQARAAALGQSLMTQILARGFDHNSDFNGGELRCGEGQSAGTPHANCSSVMGAESESPQQFNDVDDYQGCWIPGGGNGCSDLNLLVGDSQTSYNNFRVDIAVDYAAGFAPNSLKQINMVIHASRQQPLQFTAFRGNY